MPRVPVTIIVARHLPDPGHVTRDTRDITTPCDVMFTLNQLHQQRPDRTSHENIVEIVMIDTALLSKPRSIISFTSLCIYYKATAVLYSNVIILCFKGFR